MQNFPVKIQCYDESKDLVFTLEAFDECSANLTIHTLVCAKSWKEISDKIQEALDSMKLE